MAKLTTEARNDLPASAFGGPDRSYPMPDASHAENAKARAAHQFDIGNMSKDEYQGIITKANKILGSGRE